MTPFDFVFSLFGLLLGFSLIEVLGNLARTLEAKLRLGSAYRVGLLTPLLAVFVLLDLLTFWLAAWRVREAIAVTPATLTTGLVFAGSYFFAAHLVFPPADLERPDLDAHYFRVRRWVLGILFALFSAQIAYYSTIPDMAASLRNPVNAASIAVFAALLAATALAPGRILNIALLIILSGRYLFYAYS